jgi:hypothetical protein
MHCHPHGLEIFLLQPALPLSTPSRLPSPRRYTPLTSPTRSLARRNVTEVRLRRGDANRTPKSTGCIRLRRPHGPQNGRQAKIFSLRRG